LGQKLKQRLAAMSDEELDEFRERALARHRRNSIISFILSLIALALAVWAEVSTH